MVFADMLCIGIGTGAAGLAKSAGLLSKIPSGAQHLYYHIKVFRYYVKPMRAKGTGKVNGFIISKKQDMELNKG